jgi:hypothetical protein
LGFCSSSPESHDIQEGKLSRQTLGNCVWVLFLFALKAMTSKKESSQDKFWEIGFEFLFFFTLKARASNRKAVKTKLWQSSFKTLLRGVCLSRSPKEIENERLHMKPDWQERQRLHKSTNSFVKDPYRHCVSVYSRSNIGPNLAGKIATIQSPVLLAESLQQHAGCAFAPLNRRFPRRLPSSSSPRFTPTTTSTSPATATTARMRTLCSTNVHVAGRPVTAILPNLVIDGINHEHGTPEFTKLGLLHIIFPVFLLLLMMKWPPTYAIPSIAVMVMRLLLLLLLATTINAVMILSLLVLFLVPKVLHKLQFVGIITTTMMMMMMIHNTRSS